MKKHIPNTLTLANLFLGCIGIYFVFQGNLVMGAYSIWIAAVFDFLDGFMARLLKVSSPIGKELDSLADLVTFGVLPSFMLVELNPATSYNFINLAPLVLALFSALRLAKFNVDTRQTNSFIGVPTPAAAFFVSGLPFWFIEAPNLFTTPVVLIISILLSALLVIPVRMLALKFADFSIANNWVRYLLVIASIALFIIFGPKSLPIIIGLYILLSLIMPAPSVIKEH